ncbi:hypothetical protein [Massilia niastensis]|uniref:hypothetical protein n=1 Tax=Massilia niastensis TaxID=544911 RepID=UPI000369C3E5|nr:hypothetical protein [Massilia niastensis]
MRAIGCAIASLALHHLWFMLQDSSELVLGFFVMCVGDLAGSAIVPCAAKALLALKELRARTT